jgi:hypothetical protein
MVLLKGTASARAVNRAARTAASEGTEEVVAVAFRIKRRASALRKSGQIQWALAPGLLFTGYYLTFPQPVQPLRYAFWKLAH